jgi:mRNA interferase MazF
VALTFHPGPGTILICDFSTGFLPPEMVKKRPVVVISPRRRKSPGLVTVVPFSTTPPLPAEPWHHQIAAGAYPPAQGKPMWAKADILATVGLGRLDRVRWQGSYQTLELNPADMAAIIRAVKAALGFP